ncbi:MAG: dctM3 [Comamonadaceae bacterium]|nr:MAG: dctM3 [Comamonadaceae bacterium]
MNDLLITALLVGSLFLILGSGVWIGLTLSGVAWLAIQIFSARPAGDAMAVTIWGAASGWTLTALPLFIWMGEILFRTRLSSDMFKGLAPWMQALPGRLLHTNVVGCAIFAAVSGSSAATCATIGKMTLPELKRRGYPEDMTIGTLAGAGTLGLLIPPSIIMIVYGVAADVSISDLFIAGVIPGILLAALFSGYIALWALRHPEQIPPRDAPMSFVDKLKASSSLIPVVLLIVAVLGSIYAGIATATEAAGVGVVGALVLSSLQGSMNWPTFKAALMGATRLYCMIAGLHRPAQTPGRVDQQPGAEPVLADHGTDAVFHRAGLFSGRHQRGGADHGGADAHGAKGRYRPGVVWHLHRAGGGNGPDHTTGWLQPVCAARHDRQTVALHRPGGHADVFSDGGCRAADLFCAGYRDLVAVADEALSIKNSCGAFVFLCRCY